MNFKIIFSLVTIAALTFTACKKNKEENNSQDNYNFAPLLTQIGDSVIMESYTDFGVQTSNLKAQFAIFKANADESNFTLLRDAFKSAYQSWQKVAVYNYGSGPSFDAYARLYLNTFPINDATIESNISSGSYDLSLSSNIDAQGFGALDYLLYKTDATMSVIEFNASASRMTYTENLINKIDQIAQMVVQAWSPSGSNFLGTWKSREGLDAGASPAILYNQFTYELELLKKSKVGIPGGAVLGITNPDYVEAYYSGISLDLLKTNVSNLRSIFTGNSGTGFDDYLVHLGRTDLKNNILNQFDVVLNRIDGFSLPLSTEITNGNPEVMNLYADIQLLVVYAKTEMASVMGVEISYQDSDND